MTFLPLPIVVSVAPNGSYRTREEHSHIPITPHELAIEAENCLEEGVTLFHVHVRDKNGNHSLDPKHYKPAIKAIRDVVGDEMIIQITTESCGVYTPEEQIACVKNIKPEACSVAIREIVPDEKHEANAAAFFKWLYKEHICPQFILYSSAELERLYNLCERGIIPNDKLFVLFVLGHYTKGQFSYPTDLLPFLHIYDQLDMTNFVNWAACAFDKQESLCMLTAASLGGHVRIGFENNIHFSDGTIAQSNAELVEHFLQKATLTQRGIADIDTTRRLTCFR